ncbi:MAG: DMT family transporter [Lachnospiraceae bacterium]|nr:DMT family transporter [Lachnospiraceae bacterium]
MGKLKGLAAGIFWALDTVVIGIALRQAVFCNTKEAVFLAPFISTFLHDFCSCIWMLLYTGIKKGFGRVLRALHTKSGRFIVLGALFGGPVGMTGYVSAVKFLGPSYTAAISALYPAFGSFLAWIFLKERMKRTQMIGFSLSLSGMVLLGLLTKGQKPENFVLGFGCVLLCVAGWALEVVICAYGMKDAKVNNEQALMIRQSTSAMSYGIVILIVLKEASFVISVAATEAIGIIGTAACFGTASYLCYYATIRRLGPSLAMTLNITYVAWAFIFEFLFLRKIPQAESIFCSSLILTGAFVTAYGATDTDVPLKTG